MNTTRDWQQARRDLLEEGRTRVGPPPDVEQVEALLRGDLPQEEAERVRGVLAYYPELVRVMTAKDSDDDQAVLTESERENDLARIRQRLGLTPPTPLRRERPRAFAWAAGVIIALAIAGGVMVLRSPQPRSMLTKIMIADAERTVRGGSAVPAIVLAPSTDYLLKPLFRPSHAYRQYRFELVDMRSTTPRSLWTRDGIEHHSDGSFPVELSTRNLEPGRYGLILYGVDGKQERLATYAFRIDALP
jgi:hypothetical protein